MSFFGRFYLDKEKDIVVDLDMQNEDLFYSIYVENYHKDNLILHLARICEKQVVNRDGKKYIEGKVPCYIKGDGQKVYILRLNGTKLANIYPDGTMEVNSIISAIAKTLMSQTKDYKYSFRETLVKSFVPEQVKLHTDLHTHANANLNGDILIALAIKHQIRYPLYYIKKLQLILSKSQQEFLSKQRQIVENTIDLEGLKGKYRERKIDDYTFINFADLILNNIENASYNIRKIRQSLSLIKDSQAVFTNLEKLYVYRYVFTKGQPSNYHVHLVNLNHIEDLDIRLYLKRALKDLENDDYKHLTFYEDTLLWIGREYQKRHIYYVEISDTTLVKKDASNAKLLAQIHHVLPLVKNETGIDIRFLAAIRRIPLTLVRENIVTSNYLTDAMQALKVVCKDPYVVGSDFVGEEINDIAELREVIKEIVTKIAYDDPNFVIRVHAGENDSLKSNMAKTISIIEESLLENQQFPKMRIGHGLYCASLSSRQGQLLLEKIKKYNIVLEFQLTSNVRLNNLIDLRKHPLKSYLKQNILCVMGTDGYGLYGTDSIDEQIALMNFLKITDEEFAQMKTVEDELISNSQKRFELKQISVDNIYVYYHHELTKENEDVKEFQFMINKQPSYPFFKQKANELPWNKYPIVIAGGSFTSQTSHRKISESDKEILDELLNKLDPSKVFFVVGHRLKEHEKYIVDHNRGKFDIYAFIPSLMTEHQLKKLVKANLTGVRISTESQEMGIYKSFNYEIFERRNSMLFAFDGNSSITNLVQEARNGKGKTWIFIYPNSTILKDKAKSLEGYVTTNAPVEDVIEKIYELEENIGEKL